MIDTKINKVIAEGDNIFVFQYIDAEGNKTDERRSFDEFLKPFLVPYKEQIATLKEAVTDKKKIEG